MIKRGYVKVGQSRVGHVDGEITKRVRKNEVIKLMNTF